MVGPRDRQHDRCGSRLIRCGCKAAMEAIEDQVEFFNDGQEILPGIAARASFGHTPGHMAFEIRNGSESVMVVGDAIGNPHVAFERPDWSSRCGPGILMRRRPHGLTTEADFPRTNDNYWIPFARWRGWAR